MAALVRARGGPVNARHSEAPRAAAEDSMKPSMFNLQVPLPERGEVFLMNTFTDAQLLVSTDVATLLERVSRGESFGQDERETVDTLRENGFLVESREW